MRILIADDHELFCDGLKLVLSDLGPQVDVQVVATYDAALAAVITARDAGEPLNVVLLDLVMPGMPWTEGLDRITAASPDTAVVILSASDDRRLVLETVRRGAKGFIPKTSPSRLMLSALRLVLSGGVYLPPAVLDGAADGGAENLADPLTHLTAQGHGHAHPGVHPGAALAASAETETASASATTATATATLAPDAIPLTPRQREVLVLLGHGKSNKEIARILDLSEGTVKLHVTAILKALNVTNRTGAVVAASKLGLTSLQG